jgi:acyl-coenzyme A synthetase/AMP-(fatty) acid ligase
MQIFIWTKQHGWFKINWYIVYTINI